MTLVMALALNIACSDDTEVKPGPKEAGVQLDGSVKLDNGGLTPDKGPSTGLEAGTPDKGVPTGDFITSVCTKAVVGKACTEKGGECGSTATCLTTGDGKGVCTCTCTPDNSTTPLINEDSCPEATTTKYSVCGKISLTDGTSKSFCFKTCKPALGKNDCSSPVYCHPRSGSSIGQFSMAVCLFSGGCTKDTECYVNNGKPCDTKDATKKCTGTGETCQAMTTSGTAGLCQVAGKCDVKSGICDKHTKGKATAKVGDVCKNDLDCAGTQRCQIEFNEKTYLADAGKSCTADGDCCSNSCVSGTCATGSPCRVRNRNGYCTTSGCTFAKTLTTAACDATSVCNSLYSGGVCQKVCDLKASKTTALSCRGNDYNATTKTGDYLGDYECRAWNNLSIGGNPIVAKSVCDFGTSMECDMLKNSSLDCSSVGVATTNTTKMACRDEATNKTLTTKYDPKGLCLDDTFSGPIKK